MKTNCLNVTWLALAILSLTLYSCKEDEKYEIVKQTSGITGSLSWTLTEDNVIIISGNGAMPDYEYDSKKVVVNSPWYGNRIVIESVEMDSGITRIGNYAFAYCLGLRKITFPVNVTSIGNSAFVNCLSLTGDIALPDSVKTVGEWAFFSCFGLTGIVFPEGIKQISHRILSNCSSLKTVTIPSSVKVVREWAFAACDALEEITIKSVVPPDVYAYAFNGVERTIPVYVPQESLQAYKNADTWKEFTNLQVKAF
jgi:hypothetical protein